MVMALINKHYKNAKVLYRINGMANIDDRNFSPLSKRPKAGEIVRLENNYYVFDAFTSRATWSKTMHHDYDFAIVYPIDAICRKGIIEPIQELLQYRKVGKLFLCSWTDHDVYDYTMFSSFSRIMLYMMPRKKMFTITQSAWIRIGGIYMDKFMGRAWIWSRRSGTSFRPSPPVFQRGEAGY
jgi:hypothetical protein